MLECLYNVCYVLDYWCCDDDVVDDDVVDDDVVGDDWWCSSGW